MGLGNWTPMLSAKSFTLVLQCVLLWGKDKLVLDLLLGSVLFFELEVSTSQTNAYLLVTSSGFPWKSNLKCIDSEIFPCSIYYVLYLLLGFSLILAWYGLFVCFVIPKISTLKHCSHRIQSCHFSNPWDYLVRVGGDEKCKQNDLVCKLLE